MRGHNHAVTTNNQGFTLIEMVVALAIFSLAALALLRLQGTSIRATAQLQDRAIAQIVARNVMVASMIDDQPVVLGETTGTVKNAGRDWRWVKTIKRTDDVRIMRIDLAVTGADGRFGAALSFAKPIS